MRKTLFAAVAGVAVAAAAASGIASAPIPAPTGVITACYQKNNGQLRAVDTGESCTPSELPLRWNQTGPQGVAGHDRPARSRGQTGAAGAVPVAPPAPYQLRESGTNALTGTFSLELEHASQTIRVNAFAGCTPPSFGALLGNCYFTIRNLSDTLEAWLQDTVDGSPDAVRDLTVRGPLSVGGGGAARPGVAGVTGIGFTVPRLGTTTYVPGPSAFNAVGFGVSIGTSGNVSATRTYLQSWSDAVAGGATDRRDGRVNLFNRSLSETVAQIGLANLELVFPFTPIFVDGRQTLTLRPDHLTFH